MIAIALGIGFFIWQYKSAPPTAASLPEGIILFYGEGCSHCKNVDDFINQNNIEDKVKFTRLEVWYDQNNQAILLKATQKCQIASNEFGVPFLYDGNGECYAGDIDIINFFKQAAEIK